MGTSTADARAKSGKVVLAVRSNNSQFLHIRVKMSASGSKC